MVRSETLSRPMTCYSLVSGMMPLSNAVFYWFAGSRDNHFRTVANKASGSNGFAIKSFIPALKQRALSSAKAFAVIATIGIYLLPAVARMRRVASTPSIVGICISIRMIA